MVSIITEYEQLYFTPGVPDMEISTDQTSVEIAVSVTPISGTASVIYDETLYAVGGRVFLSALPNLLRASIEQSLLASVTISVTADNGSDSVTFNVRHCNAHLLGSAATVIDGHFLTMAQGRRVTSLHRTEALHYIGNDDVTVQAVYDDLSTKTFNLSSVADDTLIKHVDVSPSLFVDDSIGILVSYTVNAGSRTQQFDVESETLHDVICVNFRNAFGCMEYVYCTGNIEDNTEFSHETSMINGKFICYNVDERIEYTADSGLIPFGSVNLWKDMLRSKETFLADNKENPAVEQVTRIVITEAKPSYTNDDAEMPRFTFKFKPSGTLSICDFRSHGRIFDNSFDSTFN